MKTIYLDYMATTPIDPAVADVMQKFLTYDGCFANPASQHVFGRQAEQAIKQASKQVADLIGADTNEIIWTSGATESNNLALLGAAHFYQRMGKHIITLKTEHKSVLDPCKQLEREGFEVSYLTPDSNGLLSLDALKAAVRSDTILVSIMYVNNEIGVIQDIQQIGAYLQQQGIRFHVDAVQAAGKLEIDLQKLAVDYMSFSAHKVYGPKGIGALYVRKQPRARLNCIMYGGGQQNGLRPGTLATHQIVGMGAAFSLAEQNLASEQKHLYQLHRLMVSELAKLPGVIFNGDLTQRVAANINFSVAGVEGESLRLALRDLAISTASACTSASIEPSYVLRALGLSDELAHSALRLTIGRFTTEDEIKLALRIIERQIMRLREIAL